MSKVYTIVGGVNGVGKSSFIGVLKSQRNDCVIDDLNDGLYMIDRGISFTQETTLSGSKTLRTIIGTLNVSKTF